MKTKDYLLAFMLILLCVTVGCAREKESVEREKQRTCKYRAKRYLKNKDEHKLIKKEYDETKERCNSSKYKTQKKVSTKMLKLQYTELLEIHSSYYTVLLPVLSIYLAVMGACITIVHEIIRRMKINKKDGSKTVLIALILFSFIASGLFFAGLRYGRKDANKRKDQIFNIEENLQIAGVADELKIKHISVELLQQVILAMSIVTVIIMIGWTIMFVRGLMVCAGKSTLRDFMAYVKERILQRF